MKTARSTFEAIGTHWNIEIQQSIELHMWKELLERIHQRIEAFDMSYSRFREDSLVMQMAAREPSTYNLPPDGYLMLRFYEQLYQATGGAVTPLIGQTIADAGYDATYSFTERTLKKPPKWDEIIIYNKHEVTLKQPAILDFGAAGKGYLVDIINEIIANAGIESYLINAGGDILHRSTQGQLMKVGLENPFDTTEAVGVARISNQSICASAGSKRKWQNFHHIINAHTLSSPKDVAATWVIADDTMTADGVATALFFTDAQRLQEDFIFSYAILYRDMSLHCSNDFPAELFNVKLA